MKKYFYLENKEQLGPFTIEELKQKGIRQDTLVWYKGMVEWKRADKFPELKDILKEVDAPPPTPPEVPPIPTESGGKPGGGKPIVLFGNEMKMPVLVVLAVVMLIVIVTAIWLIAANSGSSGVDESTDNTEAVIDSSAYYSGEDPAGEGVNADDEYNQDRKAEEEAINDIVANYRRYFKASVQSETKLLGGLKNVIVTMTNNTPFEVESVTVTVEYFSKKDKSVGKDYVSFSNVAPGSKVSRIIKDSKKGKKAKAYVTRIDVPEIGLVK